MARNKKKGCFIFLKGDVWPYDIQVCLGVTRDQIIEHMERKFDNPFTTKDKERLHMTGHGLSVVMENKAVILWLKEYPITSKDFGFLAHEIFHAADMVLWQAGMTLTEQSDEAWAYLIDWITRNIFAVITNPQ